MAFELKREEASIVLVGKFNPSMFHPGWFTSNDLIRPEDLKACRMEILHVDLAVFSFEWIYFFIDRGRFQAKVKESAFYEQLRDLVVGTLSILDELNVRAIGLNHETHFQASSEEAYHAFGDILAPKDVWKKLRDGKYGLDRMVMQYRREKPPGLIQTTIAPSREFKEPARGIHFNINNHYENVEKETKSVLGILQDHWEPDLKNSLEFTQNLLNIALE